MMKRIIELSENDYKALKEEGVQNHIALADTIITHSIPYEERPKGEWTDLSTDGRHIGWIACPVCGQEPPNESNLRTNFCSYCGADLRKGGAGHE